MLARSAVAPASKKGSSDTMRQWLARASITNSARLTLNLCRIVASSCPAGSLLSDVPASRDLSAASSAAGEGDPACSAATSLAAMVHSKSASPASADQSPLCVQLSAEDGGARPFQFVALTRPAPHSFFIVTGTAERQTASFRNGICKLHACDASMQIKRHCRRASSGLCKWRTPPAKLRPALAPKFRCTRASNSASLHVDLQRSRSMHHARR